MSGNGMIVGIDYSDEYTQISYYKKEMEKPKSVSLIHDEQKYQIPTVLGKNRNTGEWCIGAQALQMEALGEGTVIKKFVEGISLGRKFVLEEQEVTYVQVFQLYIEFLLKLVKDVSEGVASQRIVFTLENADKDMIELLKDSVQGLGISRDKAAVLCHSECFGLYMLNQPEELWANETVLYDFNQDHFKSYRMKAEKGRIPHVITIEEEDYSSKIFVKMLDSEKQMQKADQKFLEIIELGISSRIVSSVYLLGGGFARQWYEKSIASLCAKRRVFQGQNLYSLGACYSMKEQEKEVLLLCRGRTLINISLLIEHHGSNRHLLLSKAGTNWYHAGAKTECILDDIRTIQLTLTSPVNKGSRTISIDLEGFPYRPNKTTRIELVIAYQNEKQFMVIVKDKGFGELFKASDKVIKQIVNVDNYL